MPRQAAATVVYALHAALVLWVVLTPLFGGQDALRMHVVLLPFLWLHWVTNQDVCALTLLERGLRGVDNDHSFLHSIVSPVYKLHSRHVKLGVWYCSILLWGLAASKASF